MANQWLRLWHDMPNNPKWRTIARLSKQPIANVMAVYLHLLVSASLSPERGEIDVSEEDLASALDAKPEEIQGILQAMQGRVLIDNKLLGWSKRQPNKEDGAAERAKAWREAKKQLAKQTNATERPEEDTEKDKDKDTDKELESPSMLVNEEILHAFAMFETWQPNEDFITQLIRMGITEQYQAIPEEVLNEFICFWMTKPTVEKTQEQWHHALAKSYQYAIYRKKAYGKSKATNAKNLRSITDTATDSSWWEGA